MQKKKKLGDRRHQMRLASYFVIFALVLNITYIPCYFYIRDLNRDNVLARYQQKMEDGVSTLGTAMLAMNNSSALLSSDAHYATLTRRPDDLSYTDVAYISGTTHTLLTPYSFIGDAGLTLGEDILYTQNRIFYQRDPLQADKFFSNSDLSTAEFVHQFSGAVSLLPLTKYTSYDFGEYDAFTVAWRWSRNKNVYFFVNFPIKKIYALFADEDVMRSGGLSLKVGEREIATLNFPENVNAARSGGNAVLEAELSSLNFRIRLLIPKTLIEANLSYMRYVTILFVSIMAAATCIWIVVCTHGAAKPVKQVIESAEKSQFLKGEMGGESSSLAGLARSIERLDSHIESYKDIISNQQERLRVQTLEKAIYRGMYSQDDMEAFRTAYPDFPVRWRMALIQYVDDADQEEEKLSYLFAEFLRQRLPKAILMPMSPDSLLLILPEGEEESREALEKLRVDTEQRDGLLFNYTLSSVYEEPQTLSSAYQQVEYESDGAMEMGIAPRQQMPLSFQQLQTLYMSLSCGNETVALETLADCARAIRETRSDFILSKCAYRMIANMLVVVKLEASCDLTRAIIPPFHGENIPRLFEEELPDCFRLICQTITDQRHSMTQDLMDSIIAYINENLSDPMLCISSITDQFHISAPTLQKRLRAATGQTFSSYVETVRLNKARLELLETNRTVQEIAESCGYATPNSFYKAYKRRFDGKPLDLRKK